MSDPLSIAASIVGVATTGFAIAKAIRQLADAIGNAGREILTYGEEIDAFARLLNMVHTEILGSLDYQFGPAIFEQVRYVCSGVLQPFHKLQEILLPMIARFKSSASRFEQFCTKVQWVFEKKREMLFYRENLRLRHGILDTALLVLISHNNRDNRPQTIHVIETSIDKSLKELQVIADESSTTAQSLKVDWQQTKILQDYQEEPLVKDGTHVTRDGTNTERTTNRTTEDANSAPLNPSTDPDAAMDTEEQRQTPEKPCMELILRKTESDSTLADEANLSDADVDEAIDLCLDPDNGKSIQQAQMITASVSQKMLEISTEVYEKLKAENKSKDKPNPTSSPSEGKYTIAIVCAYSFELAAMKSMLNKWSRAEPRGSAYVTGSIGTHSLVIYCLPHPGYGNAINFETYNRIFADFPSVMFTISLGIASAFPTISNDLRLGDVVVGRPNVRGESILQVQNYPTGITPLTKVIPKRAYNLPDSLQGAIESLRAEDDIRKPSFHKHIPVALNIISARSDLYKRDTLSDKLFKADCQHKDSQDCSTCGEEHEIERSVREYPNDPEVHFGAIASCTVPIDNTNDRDWCGTRIPNVLCSESEGAEISTVLPCLVVRGIADYGDSHKNEAWQRPAALAAAAYIRDLILWMPKASKTE